MWLRFIRSISPSGNLLFFIAGTAFCLLILFSTWREWATTSELLHQEKTKDLIALILVIVCLPIILVPNWRRIFREHSLRVRGERLKLTTHLTSGDTLDITHIFGLVGNALIVSLDCRPLNNQPKKARSFQLYKPVSSPDIFYELRLYGSNGTDEVLLSRRSVGQNESHDTEYIEGEETEDWRNIEMPVVQSFPHYTLRIKVAANSTELELQSLPMQLQVELAVGLRIQDVLGYPNRVTQPVVHRAQHRIIAA